MATERRREVSREEWFRELGLLSGKIRRRTTLRSEYFRLMGRLSALAREERTLRLRIPYAGVIERVTIGLRMSAIDAERTKLLTQMRHIRTTEIPALDEEIDRERREIAQKIVPPPVREERVADEECTGMDIFFDLDDKIYNVRDPETRELIRREEKICMELTASIETGGGHDVPVVVEITCTCYVKEKGLSDLIAAEKKVEASLREWLIEQGWGNLIQAFIKEGVAYNGEEHVKAEARYSWFISDYPKVHALVEKKEPRKRTYEGDFTVEE